MLYETKTQNVGAFEYLCPANTAFRSRRLLNAPVVNPTTFVRSDAIVE